MNTQIITITPEMAANWLEKHVDPIHKNRFIRTRRVSMYARDMKQGKWRTTHQGIAFDEYGYLRDGQHRLHAIIEADCPVKMMVTWGLETNSCEAIDTPILRNSRDFFALSDERYSDPLLGNNSVFAAIRFLYKAGVSASIDVSNNELFEFIQTFHDKLDCLYRSAISKRKGNQTTAPMYAAALAALLNGESENDICAFFDSFKYSHVSQTRNKNIQEPLLWSNRIQTARIKHMVLDKQAVYLGTQNAIWHYCNNSTSTSIMKIPKEERYPVKDLVSDIVGIEENT